MQAVGSRVGLLLGWVCLLAAFPVWSADEDRANSLWQGAEAVRQDKSGSVAAPAPAGSEGQSILVIKGQALGVRHEPDELEMALFLGVNHRQWQDVRRFLETYRSVPGHQEHIAWFAEAALLRADGKLEQAEQAYRRMLDIRPDFLRGRIDLASVLVENHKNREAEDMLQVIMDNPALPPQVRDRLDHGFLRAIAARRAWSGSLALGIKRNTNLNQSQASKTCLLYDPMGSGRCVFERNIPAAIAGQGVSYEAALNRRFDVVGQHGILLRGLAYGDSYRNQARFNEMTLAFYAGYSQQAPRSVFSVLPVVEINRYGNRTMYRAAGVRADLTYAATQKVTLNLFGERKKLFYRDGYDRNNDGIQDAVYVTVYRALPYQMAVSVGVDWSSKRNDQAANSYDQRGLRLGLYKSWSKRFDASLQAIFRSRGYEGYNALLEARRRERTQTYIASVRAPGWQWWGFSPRLSWRHTRMRSNVDWLYTYDRNEFSLMLERAF